MGAVRRRLVFAAISIVAAMAVLAQQTLAADRPSGITNQALLGLIATWIGLGIGFFTIVMTIRRDRAGAQRDMRAMQEAADARTREILQALLNDPNARERTDNRTKEVVRALAYSEFGYDPRAIQRLDLMEQDLRRLRDDLSVVQRQVQDRPPMVKASG